MISLDGPSLRLGSFAGIPIKLHWSFSLLIFFIIYIAYSQQIPSNQVGWFFAYVFLLFTFVIMHEFGHALTARHYGIRTRDIILSPIGGIARLEKLPVNPVHELIVAIAGPAVNVVLAIIFLIVQITTANQIIPQGEIINFANSEDFIGYLLLINIVLVIFNMLPAFPMDGGRVLRAVFSMILKDRLKATKWAVIIGQLISLGFIYIGFFHESYILMFIGIFVFFTARMEFKQMKLLQKMNLTRIGEIMKFDYTLLKLNEPIENAVSIRGESNFLVTNDAGEIVGALPEQFIKNAIKKKITSMPVKEYMSRSFGMLSEDISLAKAFQILNENGWAIAQVHDMNGNKKGVIDRQLLMDFIRRLK